MPRQAYQRSSYYKGARSYPYSRPYGSSYSYSSSYRTRMGSYNSYTGTRSKASKKDLIWLSEVRENHQLGRTDLDALTPEETRRNSRIKEGYTMGFDRKQVVDLAKRIKAGHGLPYALRMGIKSTDELTAPNGPKITKTSAIKDHNLCSEQLERIKPISKKWIAKFKTWGYNYNLYDVQALAAQGMNLKRGIFEPEPFGPKPGELPTVSDDADEEVDEDDYEEFFEEEDPFSGMTQGEIDSLLAGEPVAESSSQGLQKEDTLQEGDEE